MSRTGGEAMKKKPIKIKTLSEANKWLLSNAAKVDTHAAASTMRLIGRKSIGRDRKPRKPDAADRIVKYLQEYSPDRLRSDAFRSDATTRIRRAITASVRKDRKERKP